MIIGSGVQSIYQYAFASCESLESVTCLAENVPVAEDDAFKYSNVEHATLMVPMESVAAYSAAAPWNTFGKIEGIGATDITTAKISDRLSEYFTLDGKKITEPSKDGIYLVKKDGQTKMIVVKK